MLRLCAFADEASANLNEQIVALKQNGLSLLELRSIDGVSVINFTDEQISRYKKTLADNGIKVWSIGSPIGKVDINENFDEYLVKVRRICHIANAFDCKRVRMFSFFNAYDSRDVVMDRLNVMVNIAKEYGVMLCHENEKHIYGDIADRVLEIVKNVKDINIVYDPANYLQCDEDAYEAFKKTIPYTDYLHIKDVDLTDGSLVPAGYGNGKIAQILKDISHLDTTLTVEPHLKVFDGYNSIDSEVLKNKFAFTSSREAFDCAINSLKDLLKNAGYKEVDGGYTI